MLRKKYSVTGKWEAISVMNTRISADYVAMDFSLPLKRRDSIGKTSGDIVKSGMELWLNEKQLTELDTMLAQKANDSDISQNCFMTRRKSSAAFMNLWKNPFRKDYPPA